MHFHIDIVGPMLCEPQGTLESITRAHVAKELRLQEAHAACAPLFRGHGRGERCGPSPRTLPESVPRPLRIVTDQPEFTCSKFRVQTNQGECYLDARVRSRPSQHLARAGVQRVHPRPPSARTLWGRRHSESPCLALLYMLIESTYAKPLIPACRCGMDV